MLNDAKGTLPGVVYSGPDSLVTGASAADFLAEKLPQGGKVAMVEGDPGSSNALNRGEGFKNGLAKHPDLSLVASQTANWDQTKAQDIATAMLTANPDLKAFYVQNDGMAFGVATAVERAGKTGDILVWAPTASLRRRRRSRTVACRRRSARSPIRRGGRRGRRSLAHRR